MPKTELVIYLSTVIIFFSVIIFVSNWKNIFIALLMLEAMMLGIFLITQFFLYSSMNIHKTLFFLVVSICEGILGISLLLAYYSKYNSIYTKTSMSSLW